MIRENYGDKFPLENSILVRATTSAKVTGAHVIYQLWFMQYHWVSCEDLVGMSIEAIFFLIIIKNPLKWTQLLFRFRSILFVSFFPGVVIYIIMIKMQSLEITVKALFSRNP